MVLIRAVCVSSLTMAVLAASGLMLSSARATNFFWNDTAGSFTDSGSWTQSGAPVDLDGVPDSNDTATFDVAPVPLYIVTFGNVLVPGSDVHPIIDRLRIGNNTLTFAGFQGSTIEVDSANITETARGVVIGVDAGDTAVLNSTMATFETVYATLGSTGGSSGTLNLAGSAGTFSVSGTAAVYDLIVGLNGAGAINVSNGRDVSVADDAAVGLNAGSTGNINVSGADSTWTNDSDLFIGGSGTGSVGITAGGKASSDNAYLGHNSGSSGQLTIDGNGSSWTSFVGGLYIGNSGSGAFTLSGSGDVLNDFGYIGANSGSIGTATVTGSGSVWSNVVGFQVGVSGSGSLEVNNGGQVIVSGTSSIGQNLGALGDVNVSGANSKWTNAGNLVVGDAGEGTLDILAGGAVSSETSTIGNQVAAIGTITIDGTDSSWSNNGDLHVGLLGEGSINIIGGGSLISTNCYVGDGPDSTGSISVNGNGSTWTNNVLMYVGRMGDGTLSITGGSDVNSGTCFIGDGNGADGEVIVSGGSQWGASTITVGNTAGGTGHLKILEIGRVDCARIVIGDTGSVDVNGGGRLTLSPIGNAPPFAYLPARIGGTLDVSDQGLVTFSGIRCYITSGAINVSGVGTLLRLIAYEENLGGLYGNEFVIGDDEGSAELNISNGAIVKMSIANSVSDVDEIETWIGRSDDGMGVVTVNQATWYPAYRIYIGGEGQGRVEITNGGVVSHDPFPGLGFMLRTMTGILGVEGGGQGELSVDGVGSTWTGNLLIGDGSFAAGSLSITNGGRVNSAIGQIGRSANSHGSVIVDGTGSTWVITQSLAVGAAGAAVLELANGGTVDGVVTSVGTLGEIRGNGVIEGDVSNRGRVSPGNSIGSLEFSGDYTQHPTGEIVIELASVTSFDMVEVGDDAVLGGALTINLIDGFTPSVGQTFTFITADDIVGAFASKSLPSVPGLVFDVIYNSSSVVLAVNPDFTADFDEDGDVDSGDFNMWQRDFAENALSDADADGDSDGADFLTWQRQVGSGLSATAIAGVVPEPGSGLLFAWLLLITAAQSLFGRRDCRRRS